jgi:hypothetical protein
MMGRVLHAEWTKFRTVRSTTWTLVIAVAVTVLLTLLVVAGQSTDGHQRGGDDVVRYSLTGLYIGQLVLVTFGVLVMTSEYATGLIRSTFTAVPRRPVVLVAKAVVVAVTGLVAGVVATVVSFLVAQPILHNNGYEGPAYPALSLTDGFVARAVFGSAAFLALLALFGLGIGAILRRTAGALSAAIGLVLLPAILAGAVPHAIGDWMIRLTPSAGLAVMRTRPDSDIPIGPWAGLGVVAAYAVVSIAVGLWLVSRRDA